MQDWQGMEKAERGEGSLSFWAICLTLCLSHTIYALTPNNQIHITLYHRPCTCCLWNEPARSEVDHSKTVLLVNRVDWRFYFEFSNNMFCIWFFENLWCGFIWVMKSVDSLIYLASAVSLKHHHNTVQQWGRSGVYWGGQWTRLPGDGSGRVGR